MKLTFRRIDYKRGWILFTLALLLTVTATAAEEPSALMAEIQGVADSLRTSLNSLTGIEHAAVAYQLGLWCQDPDYNSSQPYSDQVEALRDLSLIKRRRFDLVVDKSSNGDQPADHATGPHWTKALRDIRRYQLEERFEDMQHSYLYLWPQLMPSVRIMAQADLLARQHQLDSAAVHYRNALDSAKAQVVRGEILLGAADVLYRQNHFQQALDTLRYALHHGGFSDDALFSMGKTMIRLGRTREAVELFRVAIEVNPYHQGAHYYLGNGYTPLNYSQIEERYPHLFATGEADSLLMTAKDYIAMGDLDGARGMLQDISTVRPDLIDPPILLAEIAWLESDYDLAEAWCDTALELCPEYGRAHAILARIQEGRLLHLSQRRERYRASFDSLPEPVIPGIDKYVANWNELAPRHRKQVALAVDPWRRFVPVLVATGQTHYIKPLHEKLSEAPNMRSLEDQRINLDSRLWDDVRGAGGYNTVTGVEDVERLLYGGYNTVVHELTHQVHGLLTEPEKKQLEDAYRAAKAREAAGTKTFMSRYQGSTVWEYFAEGVNAWETPALDEYDEREMLHERLVTLDTTLTELVQHFLAVEDVTPYYTVGYVSAAYQALEEGQADSSWARLAAIDSSQNDVRNVLAARAYVASLRNDDSTAIAQAERFASLYPNEPDGWSTLASVMAHAPGGATYDPRDMLGCAYGLDSLEDRFEMQQLLGYEEYLHGNEGLAIAWYDSALAVQADLPGAIWNRASALADSALETSDTTLFDQARTEFDRAVRLRSGVAGLRYEYARVLLMWGDLDGADAQLSEAEALRPNDPETLSYRALYMVSAGDTSGAKELIEQALALTPTPDITRIVAASLGLANQPSPEALKVQFQQQEPWYEYDPRNYWYVSLGHWVPWYGTVLGVE
ncbi:tetratricopeptide repeat protein [bacterium]|nr:tetratricopeptide repeat protein [bacterium]